MPRKRFSAEQIISKLRGLTVVDDDGLAGSNDAVLGITVSSP